MMERRLKIFCLQDQFPIHTRCLTNTCSAGEGSIDLKKTSKKEIKEIRIKGILILFASSSFRSRFFFSSRSSKSCCDKRTGSFLSTTKFKISAASKTFSAASRGRHLNHSLFPLTLKLARRACAFFSTRSAASEKRNAVSTL